MFFARIAMCCSPWRMMRGAVALLVASLVLMPAAAQSTLVSLQQGTATFSQINCGTSINYSPAECNNGILAADGDGWAVARVTSGGGSLCQPNALPLGATNPQSEVAVWETTSDALASTITFNMQHQAPNDARMLIGCFRWSITSDSRSTFADGLATGGDVTANWTLLGSPTVTVPPGMTWSIRPTDGSILVCSPVSPSPCTVPNQGNYTVTFNVPPMCQGGITGIRLEVFNDTTLPNNGPGLHGPGAGAGNFVLTELIVSCTPATTVWVTHPTSGHLYARVSQPLTFAAARAQATVMGGYLVAINDAGENDFIVQQFSPYVDGRYDWIGLTDEITEGTFLWDSGEPAVPSNMNWMSGEPNNSGNEDYASINLNPLGVPPANYGAWNDYSGTVLCNAIIEIPSTPNLSLFGSAGIGGANMTLSVGGIPCGGLFGATLVSMTPPAGGLGSGPVFGLQPDVFTIQLLLAMQPEAPPNVQPWRFDLGFPGATTAFPYTPWNAPWGPLMILPPGLTIDLVMVIVTPSGVVGSNVLRLAL